MNDRQNKNLSDKEKWNQRFKNIIHQESIDGVEVAPARVVTEYEHLLPRHGNALDLACGLGANALFMSNRGLSVQAWDLSEVAINFLKQKSEESGLAVLAEVRDVIAQPPLAESYDVIVVCRFLDRSVIPALIASLRPGGFILYQTFIMDKPAGTGPDNPDYLLQTNELLTLFKGFIVRVYREDGFEGDQKRGFRNEAMLVAQKLS